MSRTFSDAASVMRRAVELAVRGVGRVEPNPPVGAVLVDGELRLLGEGFHERFGGPHAEINALRQAGDAARGATMFVTLEPCSHHGKSGPCTQEIIAAGVKRVLAAMRDPSPHADGHGFDELRAAGVEVETGLLEDDVRRLAAPFITLATQGRPWVHAKWAMSLDGKIATRTGRSRWISGEKSREIVHVLRGRMDAIIVGIGTVLADDPLLTARPPGPRTAVRIVLDSHARLPLDSQLVRTTDQAPVLVAAGPPAAQERIERLRQAGVEVLQLPAAVNRLAETTFVSGSAEPIADNSASRPGLRALLAELGRRTMTNVLVEGGGEVLGTFFDAQLIDEFHVFIAPILIGGAAAPSPLAGTGLADITDDTRLDHVSIESAGEEVYFSGRWKNDKQR